MTRTKTFVIAFLSAAAVAFLISGPARADTAHGGRVIAPHCKTVPACHRALAWQIKDRRHLRVQLSYKRHADAMRSLRLAAAAFGIPLSEEVCIGTKESGLGNQTTPEPSSGALGLMQFLRSTWEHTPFYAFGFSRTDDDANALAAAQIVAHDGSWRQWSTRSACGL